PRPRKTSGSWKGFLFFVALAFVAVGGAAWYFGRDYLPDLSQLSAGGNKDNDKPAGPDDKKEPDEKGWDQLFQKGQLQGGDKVQVDDAHVAAGEPVNPADEPERIRPAHFASQGPDDVLLDPLGNKILDLEYSPDGRRLAAFDSAGLGTLWDLESRRGLDISVKHQGGSADSENGRHVAFSADGKTLVFGTSHNVTVVDLPSGRARWARGGVVRGLPLLISPSVRTVAIIEGDPDAPRTTLDLTVCDVASGKSLFTIPDGTEQFQIDLAFSPDDKLLALADRAHEKIRLFRLPSGEEMSGITGARAAACMDFTADGQTMVLINGKPERQLWDLSDPAKPKLTYREPTERVSTAENLPSPDRRLLASLPVVWDIGQKKERARLAGGPRHGSFSPDSRRIITWGD